MAKPIRITAEKCIGCKSCALTCSTFKSGTVRPNAAGVVVYIDQFNKEEKPIICRQCKNPKCLEACSKSGLSLDADGVVIVNEDKCTGCWDCLDACPFNALHKDPIRRLVVKCDLCKGYAEGPRCVTICPVQALTYPN